MEFELERTQLSGFRALMDTTVRQEETLEMIVPDACPDILRVVETDGKVFLRSKEACDGKVELTGTFKTAVLYLPDGESGVRHLDVTIPFTCTVENRDIQSGCMVVAAARLAKADTRAMNPRKVLVRAEAVLEVNVFAPKLEHLCSKVADGTEESVEQLIQTREVCLTACVQEKPFPISDEVTISAGRPAVTELLKSRISLECGESKIIGNKLIFKGNAQVNLLYRGEDDQPHTAEADLPISQIMEVSGVTEEAECDLTLALTGAECELIEGTDGRSVSVRIEVLAQAAVREKRTLTVLADAYSVHQPLSSEWESCTLDTLLERSVRSQNVREVWDVGGTVRELLECRMTIGEVIRSREEQPQFTTQVELNLLYTDEEGEIHAANHSVDVSCVVELPAECQCFCRCQRVGDLFVSPTMGGLEARFALDFRYWVFIPAQISSLSALYSAESVEEESERPSLVLRMLEPGERLWDVAKAYRTTIADIMAVNELNDESAASGRLLLIPRGR